MKSFIIFFLLGFSQLRAQSLSPSDKLLDKIIAVINTKVISLSEVQRLEKTLVARKEISPIIYSQSKYEPKDLLQILIRSFIIRDKINAQGFMVNDDAVESRIKMTEERIGLKRADLLIFLKGKGLTYEEYFEIIRETMEYNIFAQRIIAPLITITDQEIKNEYYRRNTSNNALSFKYDLIDFYIQESFLVDKNHDNFLSVLKDYQLSGRLPETYKNLETNKLDKISEDTLPVNLKSALKTTGESAFTKPVLYNGHLHVFYVQKKDLVESEDFLKLKESIQNDLFTQKGNSVSNNWFDRESANYYIKNLL